MKLPPWFIKNSFYSTIFIVLLICSAATADESSSELLTQAESLKIKADYAGALKACQLAEQIANKMNDSAALCAVIIKRASILQAQDQYDAHNLPPQSRAL